MFIEGELVVCFLKIMCGVVLLLYVLRLVVLLICSIVLFSVMFVNSLWVCDQDQILVFSWLLVVVVVLWLIGLVVMLVLVLSVNLLLIRLFRLWLLWNISIIFEDCMLVWKLMLLLVSFMNIGLDYVLLGMCIDIRLWLW